MTNPASPPAPAAAHTLAPTLFPPRQPLTPAEISAALSTCLSVQTTAVTQFHKRPFAALLLGPDNDSVLLTHFSIDQVNHAEASLARLAYAHYPKEFLWRCTLVSTWEPCAMCAATLYWAHIGGVVYAAGNERLMRLTGVGNRENFGMRQSAREVLAGQQKEVLVVGPVDEWENRVVRESAVYWERAREGAGSDV